MIRNYQGREAERGINFKLPGASFLFYYFIFFSFLRAHSRGESQGVCLVSANLSWGPAGWGGEGEREGSRSVSAGSEKKEKRREEGKKKPILQAQRRESFKGEVDDTFHLGIVHPTASKAMCFFFLLLFLFVIILII